jgi:uncharacterized damage-inducible protein DinB
MKRLIYIVLVCLVAPIAALAQDATANPLSATARGIFDRYSRNLVAAAEAMPADKYKYSPTPEQMSFGKSIAHVAEVNNIACSLFSGSPAATGAKVTEEDSKDKLVDGLKASMDYCAKAYSTLTDTKLSETVPFFGRKATRLGVALEVSNDLIDHYAALAIYLRLNGVLPPTARKRQ